MKILRSFLVILASAFSLASLSVSSSSFADALQQEKPAARQAAGVVNPVNINTASAEMLAALNGVGDKKAADIVAYRTTNGKFNKVEDLLNVKGIGEKTLEKNRPMLTVN